MHRTGNGNSSTRGSEAAPTRLDFPLLLVVDLRYGVLVQAFGTIVGKNHDMSLQ
jgi:hypothetical protein